MTPGSSEEGHSVEEKNLGNCHVFKLAVQLLSFSNMAQQ